jgi:peptidoglycan/xylan/chitin deacetylase (PgdA/CDA1 family)
MIKQKCKLTIRQLIASGYYATHHFLNRLQGKTVIMMYHRVLSKKELNGPFIQPGMYVKNDVFEMQMKFLKEYFEIISFTQLLDLWGKKAWDTSKRYCVITFDDGWLDNYLYAFPVLKKYNIPATIFLPTAFIGTNEWFWPDKMSHLLWHYYRDSVRQKHRELVNPVKDKYWWLVNSNGKSVGERIEATLEKCKELPPNDVDSILGDMKTALRVEFPDKRLLLNWSEIEEMSKHDISFGSHSSTHKFLTNISAEEVRQEIEDSQHVLQDRDINYIPVFCYPNGNYTQKIAEQTKQAGYVAAVSTQFGFEDNPPHYLFGLKRIGIHNDMTSTRYLLAYRLSCVGMKEKIHR